MTILYIPSAYLGKTILKNKSWYRTICTRNIKGKSANKGLLAVPLK